MYKGGYQPKGERIDPTQVFAPGQPASGVQPPPCPLCEAHQHGYLLDEKGMELLLKALGELLRERTSPVRRDEVPPPGPDVLLNRGM